MLVSQVFPPFLLGAFFADKSERAPVGCSEEVEHIAGLQMSAIVLL